MTTLPPVGAKIRVTSVHPDKTTVTIEGVVTAHPERGPGDWVEVGTPGVCAYVTPSPDDARQGAKVTVEVLELPRPPEPEEGSVVQVGNVVLIRRTYATDGPTQCWRATNDEDPWNWADICSRGTPVRLVPDPAADASTSHGIYTQPGEGTQFTRVEVAGDMVITEGSGSIEMTPSSAEAMGASYLAAARAAREAGQR